MYCFWTGEKQLAKADGVIDNKSGFINHSEVVKVTYDASVTSEKELRDYAINIAVVLLQIMVLIMSLKKMNLSILNKPIINSYR